MKNEIKRRNRLDLNTSAELAVFNAMQELEKMGADTRLTEAGILLQKAKELIADYVDTKLNLCADCHFDIPTCNGNPEFGEGVGKDNVIQCSEFHPRKLFPQE